MNPYLEHYDRNGEDEDIYTYAAKITERPDSFAYFGDDDLQRWGFFYTKTRDDDLLSESNYECIKRDAEEKFPEAFKVLQCSHWACGWVDHLQVDVTNKEAVRWCMEVIDSLGDYLIYNESDWSDREMEAESRDYTDELEPQLLRMWEDEREEFGLLPEPEFGKYGTWSAYRFICEKHNLYWSEHSYIFDPEEVYEEWRDFLLAEMQLEDEKNSPQNPLWPEEQNRLIKMLEKGIQ